MFCFFKKFKRAADGGLVLLFALILVPVVGIVGLAVDSARAYAVRSQLQQALDSAALAGGRVFSLPDADRDAVIRAFFSENLEKTRHGAIINAIDPGQLQISADRAAGILTVRADATMPVSLMRVLGFVTVPVATSTQVVRVDSKLELALALDVSKSMDDGITCATCAPTKISSLRDAAKLLVDIVFQGSSGGEVQASIVPWNNRVFLNMAYAAAWCAPPPPPGWQGSVYMRWTTGQDLADTPPGTAPFTPPATAYYPIPPVLPLTASPATLKAYIDGLTANGYTTSTVGLFWGWMTLSPQWENLWGGVPATLPRSYTDPDNIKALVLMTDGVDNTVSSSYNPMPVFRDDATDGSETLFPARNWLKARSIATCDQMKTRGIRIYTIGFGPEPLSDPEAVNLLRACATGNNFFPAADGDQLMAAFRAIGSDLAALRIAH